MDKKIYVFGAHSRGRTFREYVTNLYPDTSVEAYLVDDMSDNKPVVDGIKVEALNQAENLHTDYPVYIGTRGVSFKKITAELKELGMQRIIPVDVEMDIRLRNAYVKKVFEAEHKEFRKIPNPIPEKYRNSEKNLKATIYVATSIYDKTLQDTYEPLPCERTIQVGTALADRRMPGVAAYDDTGENISAKNRQYCEVTALYWIWKNSHEDIVGLQQYRRHFLLPDGWLNWMEQEKVDVILPVPLYVAPSLAENFRERHTPKVWDTMMDFLQKNYPEDFEPAKAFFDKGLYSPCNMLIARKSVFDEFCAWMFPILEYVEQQIGTIDDTYQNRYPGFLSERLLTYYFNHNWDRFKVVYSDKNFLK